jgi:hypothetical protein
MATYNGVNYTKAIDPSSDNILQGGLYGGRVRCQVDSYTFAEEAAATVVRMSKLPVGAKILEVNMINAALGTGVTVGIGYGASGVELLSQTDLSSAGVNRTSLLGAYEVTTAANGVVILTTAGAAAAGKVTTQTYYTTD